MREMCADLLAMYYVTRDITFLHAVISLVREEIQNPRLQETVLRLDRMTTGQVQQAINRDNCLRLGNADATNMRRVEDEYICSADAIIEPNKLIRVYPAEVDATPAQTECLVFYVGFRGEGVCILLTPPSGDLQDLLKEVEGDLAQDTGA